MSQSSNKQSRIYGYDVARALAVFGMVIVNFKLVMHADFGNAWLIQLSSMLEGRAAAMFVMLAGVGIALLTRRALSDPSLVAKFRTGLIKRAGLLVLIGLLYTPIWPADILHFYGFYFLFAAFLFTARSSILWLWAAVFVFIFLIMLFTLNYEQGWDFENLTYLDFWTVSGMIRHIFFNGFHPVFPWTALLLIGIWLGRQDLNDTRLRRWIMWSAFVIWVSTELLFDYLLVMFADSGLSPEDVETLFGTAPMPPMPQYIIVAASFSVFAICGCVSMANRFRQSPIMPMLSRTGRISLSLYVMHVLLGMGSLEAMGMLENQSIEFALTTAMIFNFFCVVFAWLWLEYFKTGPLEVLFRKLVKD